MQNAECRVQIAKAMSPKHLTNISKSASSVAALVRSTTVVVFSAGKFIAFNRGELSHRPETVSEI
jgi:hypothetical protein